MIDIPPLYVNFILGPALVPVVTMLLVWAKASARVKILVNAFVAAAVSLVATSVIPEDGIAVISWSSLALALIAFLSSSTSYDHFWKPVAKIDEARWAAAQSGIGKVIDFVNSKGAAELDALPEEDKAVLEGIPADEAKAFEKLANESNKAA